ncbi:hypothetical protein RB599_003344 [Gaeumannomyces hyphopodioides]
MLSEKIGSLRRGIHNRRLTNTAGEEFIPDKWLSDLLTEERILDALEALDDSIIDKDECPQVARDVWKFGLKTFAIFLTMGKPDLVYRFFQTDQFDKDTCGLLDRRLPMEEAKLEHALGLTHIREDINNLVEDAKQKGVVLDSNPKFKRLKEQEAECIDLCQRFMSIQDVFLSPTFPQGPLHRLLLDSTRLPFVSNSEHRETADAGAAQQPQGAFGKVSMETLPQRCYGDKRGMAVVRKELKSQGKEAYRGELRCLRLLAAARHPSLLELYVHCYANDDLKLKMIGCHHDLKPRNVLVDGGRFILAEVVDPTTLAQDRDLYFAAPENIDYVNSIRRPVGPPGDIWSLGCILAEVHTFMRGGRDAVRDFRLSRAFDQDFGDMIMTIKAFHDGLENLNPATVRHLNEMEATIRTEAEARAAHRRQHIPELGLIRLVREMLTINDLARPDIKKILQRLRCVTLQKKSEPVCDELLVSPHSKNVEFIIERQVFREWLGRLEEVGQRGQLYLPSDAAFDQACNAIDALLDELRRLSQDDLESPLFSQLRRLNEQLLSCLDVAGRLSIRRDVERNAIPIARELARESGLPATSVSETALLASGPNASILRLLAVAQVNARMRQEGDQAVPKLKSTDVTLLDPPKVADAATTFRLGTLKQDAGAVEIPVVVEEMTIEAKHAKPKHSDRLFKRLKNILVLSATDTLPDFRALSCSGIYFDMDKELIGITYKYPTGVSSSDSSTRVASLAQLLSEQPHTVDYERNLVVGLDDRVRLARDLALAVSNFHHIDWMHKNLSSHTVLFFLDATPPSGAPTSPRPLPRRLALSAPALIGFSHSRQRDETVMSSKRYHTSTELRAYHHPDLGLVLLELGHWWPLRKIVQDRRDRAAMRDYLLQRSVPFLAGAMGEAYARATEACLSGVLKGGSVEEDFSRKRKEKTAKQK